MAVADQPKYSIVIPVFNSARIVDETVDRTLRFMRDQDLRFEIVLVNDGSTDGSWDRVSALARGAPEIVAVDLIRNYGQHTAVFCGFAYADGDYVVTMDDDLQNPPEEIPHLIKKASEGYDLVFGRFAEKKHPFARRLGSRLIGHLNARIFAKPPDLVLSNFRIASRQVISRVISHRTNFPYIPGLLLMYSSRRANVLVRHEARSDGRSGYTLVRILVLMGRLLFNYSSYPLKVLATVGFSISALSFLAGLWYLGKELLLGIRVPGWTTLIVLTSFLHGFTIILLGVVGEYLARVLNQVSVDRSYQVREAVGRG